jgi:hypothetical protein
MPRHRSKLERLTPSARQNVSILAPLIRCRSISARHTDSLRRCHFLGLLAPAPAVVASLIFNPRCYRCTRARVSTCCQRIDITPPGERLPGTGKSHIAKAVAYEATLQGYSVRYAEADPELARYALASPQERAHILRAFLDPDLLVLDDLFLARRISEPAAELLQAIVHARYKHRASLVITSNRMLEDWGKYLGDNTMATTILDRLMHRAAMLRFEAKSYRLREVAARIAFAPNSEA